MNKIYSISGLKDIFEKYDFFILDQWGVMHDGQKGYINAIDCVNKLIKNKKILTIISNSSKRKKITASRLISLGFNPNYFKEIMTSGEMIWQSLVNEGHEQTKNLGKNCFYIYDESKEDGKKYLNGLNKFNFVKNIHEADFILACTPPANKTVIDFAPLLESAKTKNLLFICANPDFDTIENNSEKLIFCMGTIAELYQNIGGKVFILGKPNIEIYNQVISKFSHIDKSRILAIGDSLYHDIKGANNMGIDSLLITSTGIHKGFFDLDQPCWQSDKNLLKDNGINPTFICSDFNF